jgi:hypothetical protein
MRKRLTAVLLLAGLAPLAACQPKPAEAQPVSAEAATAVSGAAAMGTSRTDGVRALALPSPDSRAAAAAVAPPNTLGGPADPGPAAAIDVPAHDSLVN